MESATSATSILRIQQLPAYQAGGQQQQSPFAQGQFLQGSVSAKSGSGQFTIDIGGQQVLADSTAQLQVGQKLNLQVAALTPRIELRIIDNPANRLAGNSIHFLGTQASTVPALTSLAQKADLLPQLSPGSRETLHHFADSLAGGRPVSLTDSSTASLSEQLLGRALQLLQASSESGATVPRGELSALVQQAGQLPTMSPETAKLALVLAEYYATGTDQQQTSGTMLARLSEALQNNLVSEKEITQLLATIDKLAQNQPQLHNLTGLILPLLQEGADPGPTQSLLQPLIVFLAKLDSDNQRQQPLLQGKELQEIVDKLGLHMERQLADGRPEEAAKTLKFALVELSQHLLADAKNAHQAEQMVKSIESYQLLQIRLANESLLFLPLPFSFLQQGFLLVDSDTSKQQSDAAPGQTSATYELHLQLQGLGNVSIAIDQREGRVALTFLTEDAERARFLAGFREDLGQQLTAAQLESVQFLVGSKEPVKTLYEKIMQGLSGMVDTTI